MHYVFGVPLSREMPSVTELITDARQARRYGYDAPLIVSKEPGTKFSYSGGGFLLLQHIVEMVGGGKSVAELTETFLREGKERCHKIFNYIFVLWLYFPYFWHTYTATLNTLYITHILIYIDIYTHI